MAEVLKRARGVNGHLDLAELECIIDLWNKRTGVHGTVRQISKETGFSEATISNVILKHTGRRPSFHKRNSS